MCVDASISSPSETNAIRWIPRLDPGNIHDHGIHGCPWNHSWISRSHGIHGFHGTHGIMDMIHGFRGIIDLHGCHEYQWILGIP